MSVASGIKNTLKRIARYLRSIYMYVILFIRNRGSNINAGIREILGGDCEDVHIVCQGPSATMIEAESIPREAPLIFINHAVGLALSKSFSENKCCFFSSDPVRVSEVIENKGESLARCVSVLAPGHLFHLSRLVLEKTDFVYLPDCEFSPEYGLVARTSTARNIAAISERPIGYGFGTLITSISFALLFAPRTIHIWGSDFGQVAGKMYFSEDINTLEETPYELIRRTLFEIIGVLEQHNIKVMMHSQETGS